MIEGRVAKFGRMRINLKEERRGERLILDNECEKYDALCVYINPCPKQSEVEIHFSSATLFGAKVILHFTEQRRYVFCVT